MNDRELRLDISVANLGLRISIPEGSIDEYRRSPFAYIARQFHATELEVQRYLAEDGEIQCMFIRANGKRCRNLHGVQSTPGKIEFPVWLRLDRAGWYCNVHGE